MVIGSVPIIELSWIAVSIDFDILNDTAVQILHPEGHVLCAVIGKNHEFSPFSSAQQDAKHWFGTFSSHKSSGTGRASGRG